MDFMLPAALCAVAATIYMRVELGCAQLDSVFEAGG